MSELQEALPQTEQIEQTLKEITEPLPNLQNPTNLENPELPDRQRVSSEQKMSIGELDSNGAMGSQGGGFRESLPPQTDLVQRMSENLQKMAYCQKGDDTVDEDLEISRQINQDETNQVQSDQIPKDEVIDTDLSTYQVTKNLENMTMDVSNQNQEMKVEAPRQKQDLQPNLMPTSQQDPTHSSQDKNPVNSPGNLEVQEKQADVQFMPTDPDAVQAYSNFCQQRYVELMQLRPELKDNKEKLAQIIAEEWSNKIQTQVNIDQNVNVQQVNLEEQENLDQNVNMEQVPLQPKAQEYTTQMEPTGYPTLDTLRANGMINLIEYPNPNLPVTEKPRKYLHPYLLYVKRVRAELKLANPNCSFRELSVLMAENWKQLSEYQRAEYEILAAEDKRIQEQQTFKYEAYLRENPNAIMGGYSRKTKKQQQVMTQPRKMHDNQFQNMMNQQQRMMSTQMQEFKKIMNNLQGPENTRNMQQISSNIPQLPTMMPPPGPQQTQFFMQLLNQQQNFINMLMRQCGMNTNVQMPPINKNYGPEQWQNYAQSLNGASTQQSTQLSQPSGRGPGRPPKQEKFGISGASVVSTANTSLGAQTVPESGFAVFKKCLTKEIIKRQPSAAEAMPQIDRIVDTEWSKLPQDQKALYRKIEQEGRGDEALSD